MIEVDSVAATGNLEIAAGLAPTGRWFVMAEQRFKEVAVMLGLADNHVVPILSNGYMLAEPAVYERFRPQDHVDKPLTYRHKKRHR